MIRIQNLLPLLVLAAAVPALEVPEEFRVKREESFEFVQPPSILRSGDRVAISFETRAACDVTVAIEDREGRILRYLVCGVLGANAPEPFQKDALRQELVWDGKDERGHYIDDKEKCVVRVSLGLKPRFERSLYWDPRRRPGSGAGMGQSTSNTIPVPLIQPAPEGVYVFEGHGTDHLRLFDHDGNYLRTIYPFPADKIERVEGVNRATFPQDGANLPFKIGYVQATLLNSGTTASDGHGSSRWGTAAVAMAVRDGRIALAHKRLNRLATDGSSGGLPLYGPKVTYPARMSGSSNRSGKEVSEISPTSAAFSPDGKRLYLTGYLWREGRVGIDLVRGGHHGVVQMDFEKDQAPAVFAGSMEQDRNGSDNAHFTDPVSVACDAKGRVYVADFMNDRVQVFEPDGKFFKSLPTPKPARIAVHPQTGELHVFSWAIHNTLSLGLASDKKEIRIDPRLTVYGPIERPERRSVVKIPFENYSEKYQAKDKWGGLQYSAAFDPWANPPTLWVVSSGATMTYLTGGGNVVEGKSNWERWNIRLYGVKGGETQLRRDFGEDVAKSVTRHAPPAHLRQRLYVNPKNRKLYVAEQNGLDKSFDELQEIDPESGEVKKVPLPFNAEDLAFDLDGYIYLRGMLELVRYDPSSQPWREVPFDYGDERGGIAYGSSSRNRASAISCIPLYTGTLWHKGGLWVAPNGHIAISCYSTKDQMPHIDKRTDSKRIGGGSDVKEGEKAVRGAVYVPPFYPGRTYYGQIHVYDRRGQRIRDDEVPGTPVTDGLFLDQDGSIYIMIQSTRNVGGKPYFSDFTGTLMKFRQGEGRMLSEGLCPLPLSKHAQPKRPPDTFGGYGGNKWIEGAQWMYGGVGYAGRAYGCRRMGGITCACANTRFALDYFKRTFAPEFDRYSVAVLDTNGNLILRVGRYGNADDGLPLVREGGPPNPRRLGGDETGLFYPVYLATESDRRLFIADIGNQRVVSVRLDYHTERRVALKDVEER